MTFTIFNKEKIFTFCREVGKTFFRKKRREGKYCAFYNTKTFKQFSMSNNQQPNTDNKQMTKPNDK
jgi:hypothetical protein